MAKTALLLKQVAWVNLREKVSVFEYNILRALAVNGHRTEAEIVIACHSAKRKLEKELGALVSKGLAREVDDKGVKRWAITKTGRGAAQGLNKLAQALGHET